MIGIKDIEQTFPGWWENKIKYIFCNLAQVATELVILSEIPNTCVAHTQLKEAQML